MEHDRISVIQNPLSNCPKGESKKQKSYSNPQSSTIEKDKENNKNDSLLAKHCEMDLLLRELQDRYGSVSRKAKRLTVTLDQPTAITWQNLRTYLGVYLRDDTESMSVMDDYEKDYCDSTETANSHSCNQEEEDFDHREDHMNIKNYKRKKKTPSRVKVTFYLDQFSENG